MESLSFTYSPWLLIPCIALAIGYAALMYYRNKTFKDQPIWLRSLLILLRFTAILLISIFLLKPYWRTQVTDAQKPIVAFLIDNSESVKAKTDSVILQKAISDLSDLKEGMNNNISSDWVTFGEEVTIGVTDQSFDEKLTDIGEAIDYVQETYNGLNLGAVILATDGIYTAGRNPLYVKNSSITPYYIIPLGDTSIVKDAGLRNAFYNRIGYLGDQIELQLDVEAKNLSGETLRLSLYRLGTSAPPIESKILNVDSKDYFQTVSFFVEPTDPGVNRYRVILSSVEGEENTSNNTRDFYLEVLDSRQKILILANAPHPDLAALKNVLESKKTKEANVFMAKDFRGNFNKYDLVILHQLPGTDAQSKNLVKNLVKTEVPYLFILGSGTDIRSFNSSQDLMKIAGTRNQLNEVEGYFGEAFGYFVLEKNTIDFISTLPPLYAPFGEYKLSSGTQTLLYQKIGEVESGFPLITLSESGNKRSAVIAGEGIWKWKLFNYLEYKNFDHFETLIDKITQFLSVKSDKRRLRVDVAKNVFNENEDILFGAELYNSSYERIQTEDIPLEIFDDKGNEYEYLFDKTSNGYKLDAGRMEEGNYTYRSSINIDDEDDRVSGAFSVQPIQLELYRTTADYNLLKLMSEKTGGKLVSPTNISSLESLLEESGSLKPILYSSTRNAPLINLKAFLFILLLLLGVEWFIRKYLGAY